MMLPAYEAFCDHAAKVWPAECCGLIVNDEYIPCRNVAPLDHFEIHPGDWDAAEDAGTIQAVCHSHPCASASPSLCDVASCKESGLPWFILGAGDELQRIDPEPIPFLERPFVYGWSDCYSLVRDYFGDLPDFPREDDFEHRGHSPFDVFPAHGFQEVSLDSAQRGDLLLMQFNGKRIPQHCAVCLGDGSILHHPLNQFSRVDLLGPYLGHITHVLRRSA